MFDVFVASLCVVSKVVCIQPVSEGQSDLSYCINCFSNIGAIIIVCAISHQPCISKEYRSDTLLFPNSLCVISQRHQPCISKDIRPDTLFFFRNAWLMTLTYHTHDIFGSAWLMTLTYHTQGPSDCKVCGRWGSLHNNKALFLILRIWDK